MSEKYKPSDKEIKKAEDMISPEQKAENFMGAKVIDHKTIMFNNKQIYSIDDSRYTIGTLKENKSHIVWLESAMIDVGQHVNAIRAYDKKKKVVRDIFSITDERLHEEYNVYLNGIEGDTCDISILPESGDETKYQWHKKINLKNGEN